MVNRQPLAADPVTDDSAPSIGAPAADWPILATLPWIDAPAESHDAYTAASYRLDPGVQPGESLVAPPRYSRLAELSGGGEEPSTSAAAVNVPPVPSRRFRIDSAAETPREAVAPPHRPAFVTEKLTVASRLFQLHAALAPHAGLATTAALVAAVAVLSWLTFGPRPVSSPANKSVHTPLWPEQEAAAPLTLNRPARLSPTEDLSQFSWSARLLPKAVPATDASAPVAPLAHQDNSSAEKPEQPATPESTLPKPTEAGDNAPVAAAPASELAPSTTPTPEPPYPTTPYAAITADSLRITLDPNGDATPPDNGSAPSTR
jgi:hypothetical protein